MNTITWFALAPYLATFAIVWIGISIKPTRINRILLPLGMLAIWIAYMEVCVYYPDVNYLVLEQIQSTEFLPAAITALFTVNWASLLLYLFVRILRSPKTEVSSHAFQKKAERQCTTDKTLMETTF